MPRLFWLALAALPLGCAASPNEDPGLRGADLPALSDQTASMLSSTPAPVGPDRRAWPVTTVIVPTGQTLHAPAYGSDPLLGDGSPRRSGRCPDAATALLTSSPTTEDVTIAAWEWLAPLRLIGDAAYAKIVERRMPWSVETSPRVTYQRRGASEMVNPEPEASR